MKRTKVRKTRATQLTLESCEGRQLLSMAMVHVTPHNSAPMVHSGHMPIKGERTHHQALAHNASTLPSQPRSPVIIPVGLSPHIFGISPSSAIAGRTTTVTVYGSYLPTSYSPSDYRVVYPTLRSVPGINVVPTFESSSTAVLQISIADTVTSGTYLLEVRNGFSTDRYPLTILPKVGGPTITSTTPLVAGSRAPQGLNIRGLDLSLNLSDYTLLDPFRRPASVAFLGISGTTSNLTLTLRAVSINGLQPGGYTLQLHAANGTAEAPVQVV